MTARVYGVISLFPSVGRETGLSSVPATHSASGSPVMMSTATPGPGSGICVARVIAAEFSWAPAQISAATTGSRRTPEVVRLTSIPAMGISSLAPQGRSEVLELRGETLRCGSGRPADRSLRGVRLRGLRAALRGQVRLLGEQVGDRGRDLLPVGVAVDVDLELGEVEERQGVGRVGQLAGGGSADLGRQDAGVGLLERLRLSLGGQALGVDGREGVVELRLGGLPPCALRLELLLHAIEGLLALVAELVGALGRLVVSRVLVVVVRRRRVRRDGRRVGRRGGVAVERL